MSGPAFDELDKLVYSDALMRDPDVIIDQSVKYAAASQQMGFILGFKYALRLAAEAFSREEAI